MTPGPRAPAGDHRPVGEAALARFADAALEAASSAGAAAADVRVRRRRTGLTRIAGSQIHQNTTHDECTVSVRAVSGDAGVGVVRVGGGVEAVAGAASRAAGLARHASADADMPTLAPPAAVDAAPWDAGTADAGPGDRAEALGEVVATLPTGMHAAGSLRTDLGEVLVATSEGQRVYSPRTDARLVLVVTGPSSTGYAEAGARAIDAIDAPATARRAAAKARAGSEPVDVPTGQWPVVLEPSATAALVQYLALLGFGGRRVAEGRSFAGGRFGERALDPRVSVVDDAHDPAVNGYPFDAEGTPTRRVTLVDGGILSGVVHDRRSAALAGTDSTGHALEPPNVQGPLARHALLLPGTDGSLDELVGRLDRGLLVTRLHYVNVVNDRETLLTGMTRDGTFLVEDGRVVAATRNLRFTESVHGALAHVDGVGSEATYATGPIFSGGRQPALALPAFRFTTRTSFG